MSRPVLDEGDIPAVRMIGVSKRYNQVVANASVNLDVRPGTVHALVGENGAGKSTLMRILAGVERPDAGEVRVKGRRMARHDPRVAMGMGIGMVHQHFMLVDSFTVAENVVLGREPSRHGLLDRSACTGMVGDLARRFGLAIDPSATTGDLSVGERQRIEILKVLYRGADVLVLDEPTAVLTPVETEGLFRMIRGFTAAGSTVILITHHMDEVMAISDRVTVMRAGANVGDFDTSDVDQRSLVHLMVGREVAGGLRKQSGSGGTDHGLLPAALEVVDLVVGTRLPPAVDRVSLAVCQGEVYGLAGVQGNGQSELLDAIAGLRPVVSGRVAIGGREVTRLTPAARIEAGLAHIPEDRNDRGLVTPMTVVENLVLGRHHGFRRWTGLDRDRMAQFARALVERFDIRPAATEAVVRNLSGGNAQKVVVARAMAGKPSVLLAGQPTRGVDIGAVETIHREVVRAVEAGMAVLLVSADLGELLALSDRIGVIYRGRLVAEVAARDATSSALGEWMTGAGGDRPGCAGGVS